MIVLRTVTARLLVGLAYRIHSQQAALAMVRYELGRGHGR